MHILFHYTMKKLLVILCSLFTVNCYSQYTHESIHLADFLPLSESENSMKTAQYTDKSLPPEVRALDLIQRMTLEEKCTFTGGWFGFFINGIPRLGIRPVFMADASQGLRFRKDIMQRKTTAYPGMLSLAATWNRDLARKFAECVGEECRAYGVDLLLGPGVNMYRVSSGGRNYEYMGEDPYLTSEIATEYVKGLQSKDVISVMKHFICNDQEFVRHIASCNLSERALREIYLPVWEKAIKEADLAGIMTGNNSVNGVPMCMNKKLLNNILRKEYGFKGIAMTDWRNSTLFPEKQHHILPSGMNLMMPVNETFIQYVIKQIQGSPERKAEMEVLLDYMIYPTLYTMFEYGIYDRSFCKEELQKTLASHKIIAREVAEEAIILLKNNHILPISLDKNILLVNRKEAYTGSGSGAVPGYDHVSYYDGLKKIYGNNIKQTSKVEESELKKYDIIIYEINKVSGEGGDTPYDYPKEELDELRQIAKVHKNILVLVNASNSFPLDWTDQVKGILWCGFLGQERGSALADIISGKKSPSGKLPFTIEKNYQDMPSPQFNFLGGEAYWKGNAEYQKYWLGDLNAKCSGILKQNVKPHELVDINYDEGIYIGYRWYDKHNTEVGYPFGFGLSYTKFEYSNIQLVYEKDKLNVSLEIKNVGCMEAKEIIQLYISNLGHAMDYPKKELKAFTKVNLQPKESKKIEFYITNEMLKSWNEQTHSWFVEDGAYMLSIGSSSEDIRFTRRISKL